MTESRLLSFNNKITFMQAGVVAFMVLTTFKFSLFPSVVAMEGGFSALYVVVILAFLEGVVTLLSLYVASKGGLSEIKIHKGLKICLCIFLFPLAILKASGYLFEFGYFITGTMFENISNVAIFIAVLLCVGYLASRGFSGISRTALLLIWSLIFALLYNAVFGELRADFTNLFPLFRGQGDYTALLKSGFWFGDGFIFLFADISNDKSGKVRWKKGFVWVAVIFSFLTIVAFFLAFFAVYGESAQIVNNAFYRVMTQSDRAEVVGVLDWPIMLVWIINGIICISALFCSAERSLAVLFQKGLEKRPSLRPLFVGVCGILICLAYFILFENRYRYFTFTSNLVVGLVFVLLVAFCEVSAFVSTFRRKNEL